MNEPHAGYGIVTMDESPRRRSGFGEWPIALVLLGVIISLVVASTGHVRGGVLTLAGTLGLGGLLRLALPTHRVGILAVRRRAVDVITLLALGAVVTVLGLITRSH